MDSETSLWRVLGRLENVRPSGDGYSAQCPAHDDNVSSLSVSSGDTTGVVLRCHAGCTVKQVLAALELSFADIAGDPVRIAQYPYHDLDGTVLYTVERWANPKTFRCVPSLPEPARRVLFAAQWIAYARDTGQTLYVVEGEKDACSLHARGIPATCNPLGAGPGKWYPHYSDQLAGCIVVVVADNDEPGKEHARTVAAALRGIAKSVALAVPHQGHGKDVTEFLDKGYTLDRLATLPEREALPALNSAHVMPGGVDWVWPSYIPRGKLSTVEGDPGDGKSTLTIDLVARWSIGAAMPDGTASGGPYTAMMISAEDDPEDTIVPRLIAAGADRHRVFLLSSGSDPERPFNLGVDMAELEHTITNLGVQILVLDPLSSFLPDDTDSHSDHKIRRALYPLHLLARRTNVAVIAVRHLSKSATKAVYAGNGSIGIIAAARAAFMVGPIPGGESLDRALVPIKCNLAAKPPALGYRVQVHPLHGTGYIQWFGPVDIAAQDVLDGEQAQAKRTARDDARDYLSALLDHTWMTWKEIVARGKADGYTEITLERVRSSVLMKHVNPIMPGGEMQKGTYWSRVDQPDTLSDGFRSFITFQGGEETDEGAEAVAESDSAVVQPPGDDLTELLARPAICEVCGSTDATPYPEQMVVRCPQHDPRHWSPE